ncbi:MAG: LLM class F420-dependent oxidoreductase [Pseudomonadales bacterium]|jgi:probable F420-dependent oxidoreductase
MLPRLDLSQCGRSIAENVDLVQRAEALGWEGAWVSEITGTDAVTAAASIAGALTKGRVGSAIFPMQTRDPLLLAMTAASLSDIAAGGFVLGLGTSTPIIIQDWHATPWGDSPLTLTRECVGLVRRFLTGERVTTESGRWLYRRASLTTPPKSAVPIYLAALNDRMLQLAGEIADGVILNFVSVGDLIHAKSKIAEGAGLAGRSLDNFEYVIFFRSTVTDDYELVRERYQRELLTYVMAPVYQKMFARGGHADLCDEIQSLWRDGERETALATLPEAFIRDRTLIGSATEIHTRLAEYQDAGLDSSMIFPVAIPTNDYFDDTLRTIEALAPGN